MKLQVGLIVSEEWRNIFKDKRLFAVLFIVPIIYTVMFGYLYSNHRLKEINTVVLDQDQTPFSRQIIQAFNETETFNIMNQVNTEIEVQRLLEAGKSKVGIIIPKDSFKKILRGEEAPILTMIDGSNMLFSNVATKSANEVISTFSYRISSENLMQKKLNADQVQLVFQAIPYRTRVLYNGAFNYSYFLTYGLIGAVLQQVLLLGLSLTITRDKERGEWDRFEEWRTRPWLIAYAKTAPYFLIGLFNIVATFLIAIYGFVLPSNGSIISVVLLSLAFTFALLGIGYLASLFSANQVGATQVTMLLAVPSFLLSGFTWPFEAMPTFLNRIGHLLPLTYFLDGVRNIFVKGVGLEFIWKDVIILFIMGFSTFFVAMFVSSLKMFWKKTKIQNEINRISKHESVL